MLFASRLSSTSSAFGGFSPTRARRAARSTFGGFAPAILTWMTQVSGGSVFAPAWYVMAAAALALFSIMFLPNRAAQHATYDAAT